METFNITYDDSNIHIHAWHPSFKLDDVPHIEQADIPQPPCTGIVITIFAVIYILGHVP